MRILNEKVKTPTTTVYRCGPLIDLCRGPHIRHTGKVKAFKVIKVNYFIKSTLYIIMIKYIYIFYYYYCYRILRHTGKEIQKLNHCNESMVFRLRTTS